MFKVVGNVPNYWLWQYLSDGRWRLPLFLYACKQLSVLNKFGCILSLGIVSLYTIKLYC